MPAHHQPQDDAGATTLLAALLHRNGWALAAIASATVLVELGAYVTGRMLGIGPVASVLAALASAAVWTALAAPAAAAGGKRGLDALFRGGIVADASAISLLVLWLVVPDNPRTGEGYFTFLAAVKIYCTLAAMALAAVAVVLCARSVAGRHALAVAVAAALVLLLTSLLWAGIPLAAAPAESRTRVAAATLWINPFWSIGTAIVRETDFVWTRYGMMYRLNLVRHHATPNVPWYAATVCCLCVAGIAASAGVLRRLAPRGRTDRL